ncbi:MAG: ester cyclase [Candidatus Thorarchaeota archaeon]
MSKTNKEIVLEFIEEVWNKGNVSQVEKYIAPEYEARGLRTDCFFAGPEASRQNALTTRSGVSDFQITFEQIISEGDTVAAIIQLSGRSKDSGKLKVLDEMIFFKVVDGMIRRAWSIGSEWKVRE